MGFFDRLKEGLAKTRKAIADKVSVVLAAGTTLEPATYEELEAGLLSADLGAEVTGELLEKLRRAAGDSGAEASELRPLLARTLKGFLEEHAIKTPDLLASPPRLQPEVTLVVGVNGSGKTTTCGKLAARWSRLPGSPKVLLAAGDTFRAAAEEQLEIWAGRAGVEFFSQQSGADPSALAFDACRKAAAGGYQRLIIDTAGRLQTKVNLMEELRKVKRVCDKALPGAPHEVLLVLDSTTGQNMLSQVKLFHEAVPLTGLIVTKLDGSAKAGALLSVLREFKIPVRLIGVGESLEDLQAFDPGQFAEALAGN